MNSTNQNLTIYREWISKLNFIHEECMYYRNKISHLISLNIDENMHQKAKRYSHNILKFIKELDKLKRDLQGISSFSDATHASSFSEKKLKGIIDKYILLKNKFSVLRVSLSNRKSLTAA